MSKSLKLMVAKGAQIEWSPTEIKKEKKEGAAGGGRGNPNVGKTPAMVALTGGRGAAFAAGPGFERLGPPPFREASNREPHEALEVLLAAGADPNAKAPDGASLLHQAVTARQVAIVRTLVGAGAKLDAVNKDNLTPLLLAEKPEPPPPPGNNTDSRAYRPKRDSREDVIAALRELMNLGPNDPAPVPPPLPASSADEKKDDEKKCRTKSRRKRKEGRRAEARDSGPGRPGTTRDDTMKKVLTCAALIWVGAAVPWAQSGSTARPETAKPQATTQTQPARTGTPAQAKPAAPATASQPVPSPADASKYQAWVKQVLRGLP